MSDLGLGAFTLGLLVGAAIITSVKVVEWRREQRRNAHGTLWRKLAREDAYQAWTGSLPLPSGYYRVPPAPPAKHPLKRYTHTLCKPTRRGGIGGQRAKPEGQ